MYYPCSENRGADQLRGYREADLRFLFSHMQKAGFLMTRLILCTSFCNHNIRYGFNVPLFENQNTKSDFDVPKILDTILNKNLLDWKD